MPAISTRPRWGDQIDEDDLLPPPVTKGPDEHGIKTVIEYYRNDKGEAVKKTSKLKVVTVERKVYSVSPAKSIRLAHLPAAWLR